MMLTRRSLLLFGIAATGVAACRKVSFGNDAGSGIATLATPLHPLLTIEQDNCARILITRTEMGQGVTTALAWLMADQLQLDWSQIRIEHHRFEPAFGAQGTSASFSVYENYATYRRVGRAAREALLAAAALHWSIDPRKLSVERGWVRDTHNHRSSYAELAPRVVEGALGSIERDSSFLEPTRPMPTLPRSDAEEKILGRACFGADVRLAGMKFAVLRRVPPDRRIASVVDVAARAVPGLRAIRRISAGIACVADTTWAAKRASEALEVALEPAASESLSLESITARLWRERRFNVLRSQGDGRTAARRGSTKITQSYRFPLLAHAALEPVTATVSLHVGGAEVWAPTQKPAQTQREAAEVLGLPLEQVTVHKTYVGGGFGRKAYQDVVREAAEVAMHENGPVQLILTREQDFAQDYYRPSSEHRVWASADADGRITGWHHQAVAPSVLAWYPSKDPAEAQQLEADYLSFTGVDSSTYEIDDFLAEGRSFKSSTRMGIWRSIGHSASCYVNETTIDSLARTVDIDPVRMRLRNLAPAGRMARVLAEAAERSQWSQRDAERRPMGAAIFRESFPPEPPIAEPYEVYVAHIAELAPRGPDRWKLVRMTCVVDCGLAICPDLVRAQFEGAITWALTGLFNGIEPGTQEINFHRYLPTRMADLPRIDIHLLPSQAHPGGVGEKGVPGVGPAIANALVHARGRLITELPWPRDLLAI